MSDWIQQAIGGSVLLALPVALLAGLVSFFSPCVLPLLPGYLSYATGLGASEITSGAAGRHRRRVLAGTLGFVAGLAVVFVATGALAGTVGAALVTWQRPLSVAAGLIAIALGLVFTGWLPFQATWRPGIAPRLGVAASPLLGIVFALGWTPCIGPTLGAILTMAAVSSGPQVALLLIAYCLGLGVPFVVLAVAADRTPAITRSMARHGRTIELIGGALVVVMGVAILFDWLSVFSNAFVSLWPQV